MTMDQEQRLKEITAETLGVDVDEIDDDASTQTLASWTSLNHLTLMAAVEESLGIMFSMDDMTSVGSFLDLRTVVAKHVR